MINRLKVGLPVKERVALYHAFVEPSFQYCAPVWADATQKLGGKIGVAQRDTMRAIVNYEFTIGLKKVNLLYKQLEIEDVEKRWCRQDAVWLVIPDTQVRKIRAGILVQLREKKHGYDTRSRNDEKSRPVARRFLKKESLLGD